MSLSLPATPLFTNSGVLTEPFQALLSLTGLQARDALEARQVTEASWLQPGKKAAEIVDIYADRRDEFIPHLRALQFLGIQPLQPAKYDWVVLLGALYVAIHKREKVAVDAWKEHGVQWSKMARLGSRRPRYDDSHPTKKETDAIITQCVAGGLPFHTDWTAPGILPRNEGEIIPYIVDQVSHNFPWKRMEECIVITEDANAGTKETLETFCAEQDPHGDSVLIIGSQPHMLRLHLIAASVLGKRFRKVDATGYDMPAGNLNISQALNEMAQLVTLVTPV